MSDKDDDDVSENDFKNIRYLTAWVGLLTGVVVLGSALLMAFLSADLRNDAVKNHLMAIVGFPIASGTAITIVSVFRSSEGPMKVELLGLKFEGASGPILMWVICFGICGLVLRLLW